ncbi:hypothetical protein TNCV_4922781 [Trichonephila clavipes]|nr:hypothetical protein TNCV_4922781 [Trichonephila clavipes]
MYAIYHCPAEKSYPSEETQSTCMYVHDQVQKNEDAMKIFLIPPCVLSAMFAGFCNSSCLTYRDIHLLDRTKTGIHWRRQPFFQSVAESNSGITVQIETIFADATLLA